MCSLSNIVRLRALFIICQIMPLICAKKGARRAIEIQGAAPFAGPTADRSAHPGWTLAPAPTKITPMRPVDVQVIGAELAIKWDDGAESYIGLETLRRRCPCAGCQGEMDVLGHRHVGPNRPLTAQSLRLVRLETVGAYAIQPIWGDGHNSGIYAYDYLRQLGQAAAGPA
jgi:DUF971 family protein